jgi:hypothetical protein
MYVDLNYTSRKKLPVGYSFIGGLVDNNGLRMLLVRDETGSGEYSGILNGEGQWLDQTQVRAAIQVAEAERASERTVPSWAPEKKKLYSVNLDEWTIQALRAYGNGNLSAGIRAAAKLLVGIV